MNADVRIEILDNDRRRIHWTNQKGRPVSLEVEADEVASVLRVIGRSLTLVEAVSL